MPMMIGTVSLEKEKKEQFGRDGILFPIPVLSGEEVQFYRSALAEMKHLLGLDMERLPSCELYFPWAHDLAFHPRVLAAVAEILGPDVVSWGTLVLDKPPRSRVYVSWHQDGAYASFLNGSPAVSAWIALTDSTVESGCMRVVRETHRQPVKHTELVTRDNLLKDGQTAEVAIDENRVEDVILKAGEMSLHDANIIHGSNPNASGHHRIGFIARFAAPGVNAGTQVLRAKGDRGYERLSLLRPVEPLGAEILQCYKDFLCSPAQTRRFRAG
jgi:non-heme Fe2+,alpha-ketoglutarate-dependent halogenase